VHEASVGIHPQRLAPVEITLSNRGDIEVRVEFERRDRTGRLLGPADQVHVAPVATVSFEIGPPAPNTRATSIVTIRATRDLEVSVLAVKKTGALEASRRNDEPGRGEANQR
jgi:hypothetical protein